MEKIGEIGNFLCFRNVYNILHKTGVRVSMEVFTFLKFYFKAFVFYCYYWRVTKISTHYFLSRLFF